MVSTRSMTKALPLPKVDEKKRGVTKKGQVKEAAKRPYPMHLYPVLRMTLQCMDTIQLVNYSFSSPQAAHNVKLLGIEVELMRINLKGVLDENSFTFVPDDEQGIELTFTNRSRSTVHWWFSNAYDIDTQEFHEKISVDGTVLKKCFQKVKHIMGCRTKPSELVSHLKAVENHFRTIFRIRNTDIEMDGTKVAKYAKYLDKKSPKTCQQLIVNSELARDQDVDRLFGSIQPTVVNYNLSRFRVEMPEVVVDKVQMTKPWCRVLSFHLSHLNAREFQLGVDSSFVCLSTVRAIIEGWKYRDERLKCRDRLEVVRFQSRYEFNRDALTSDLGALRFDGTRRPSHYRKLVDGVTEVEVDMSTGHDIVRDDGKMATIFMERNDKVVWFIVWN